MRNTLRTFLLLSILTICLAACGKKECKECVQTICGIASCEEFEKIKTCDPQEVDSLENSNNGNVFWNCE